jgi:hypothetical protein
MAKVMMRRALAGETPPVMRFMQFRNASIRCGTHNFVSRSSIASAAHVVVGRAVVSRMERGRIERL